MTCYVPILIHDGLDEDLVRSTMKDDPDSITEDKSKVTCQQCLEYIHA